jgi:hypothetical protein
MGGEAATATSLQQDPAALNRPGFAGGSLG